MKTIRIGAGAGYSDRVEPAIELAEKGELNRFVFECLAERTIALAQQVRMKDPRAGYDPLLADRIRAVLPVCVGKGVKIVTNIGAANPTAAAREIARKLGLSGLKVARRGGRRLRPGPEPKRPPCGRQNRMFPWQRLADHSRLPWLSTLPSTVIRSIASKSHAMPSPGEALGDA